MSDDDIAKIIADAQSARSSAQSIETPEVRRALERLANGLEELARFVKSSGVGRAGAAGRL